VGRSQCTTLVPCMDQTTYDAVTDVACLCSLLLSCSLALSLSRSLAPRLPSPPPQRALPPAPRARAAAASHGSRRGERSAGCGRCCCWPASAGLVLLLPAGRTRIRGWRRGCHGGQGRRDEGHGGSEDEACTSPPKSEARSKNKESTCNVQGRATESIY
jgi:hypothetical protein